jgi:SAM-dependent methyltransferase
MSRPASLLRSEVPGASKMNESTERFRHPLLRVAEEKHHLLPPPPQDITPDDYLTRLQPGAKARFKRLIGELIYPPKNTLQRNHLELQLADAGVSRSISAKPDLLTWGDRGFSNEILLAKISRKVGKVESVACFGCGIGDELLLIGRLLRPKRIIGFDFLNYGKAWDRVKGELAKAGIEADFVQCDLRHSVSCRQPVDLLISFAVLEHLHNIPETLSHISKVLKRGGWFASVWGPLWHTYSGDHIAGELGFEHGYDHLRLGPDEYLKWYASHPRNEPVIKRGEPTWLEMGLVSFALYDEYLDEIVRRFGNVAWLGWAISHEALIWRRSYPALWQQILGSNAHVRPLDLLLKSAAVLARNES